MPKFEDDGDLRVRRKVSDLHGVRIHKIERDSRGNYLVYAVDGSELNMGAVTLIAMIKTDALFDSDGNYFED
jgi:hypothetical protein